jgi:hypothetical protein
MSQNRPPNRMHGPSTMWTTRPERRNALSVVMVTMLLLLAGCASHYALDARDDPYGFFSGIWHGIVFPYAVIANIVSWLLSLLGISFLSSIEIIGRPNTGFFFYYIGFLLGISVYGSGAARN